MSEFIVNAFQVPNAVHDEVMPAISDVALRCYLTIIRQTIGWQKTKDKISISQFVEKTSRSKPSVIKGVKELLELGLINKTLVNSSNGEIAEYSINLNFDGLKNLTSKKSLLVKKVNMTSKDLDKKVVKKVNTQKDTITKDTITKDSSNNSDLNLLAEFNIIGDLAKDFIKVRKSHKAPITKTALNGFVRESRKANISLEEAIRFTVEKCWRGFTAEWFKNQRASYNNTQSRVEKFSYVDNPGWSQNLISDPLSQFYRGE